MRPSPRETMTALRAPAAVVLTTLVLGVSGCAAPEPEEKPETVKEAARACLVDFASHDLGRALRAIDRAEQTVHDFDGDPEAHRLVIEIHERLGLPGHAVEVYERLVAARPDDHRAHFGLAYFLEPYGGRAEEREHHFREALRLDPDQPAYHLRLVQHLIDGGKLDEAREALHEAHEAIPRNPLLDAEEARLALHSGQPDEAERLYREGIERWRVDPALRAGLCQALLEQGRATEAYEIAADAYGRLPHDEEFAYQVGRLALRQADEELAREAIARLATLRRQREGRGP